MDSDVDDYDTDDCDDEQKAINNYSNNNSSSSNEEDSRGLVGLQNLGNTCYMNGALQALSNCQQLTRFVLDCPGFMKDTGLSRSYSELIREIWVSRNSHYAIPASIIRNIKCIYPAFRGCTQQDTQEFLRCFLEQLHDELKQPNINIRAHEKKLCAQSKSSSSSSIASSSIECPHETDKALNSCSDEERETDGPIKTFTEPGHRIEVNNSHDTYRSIISDTFEFKISSSVVCSNCNNISTTKETFKDLSVPIPSRDHPYYQTNKIEFGIEQEVVDAACAKMSIEDAEEESKSKPRLPNGDNNLDDSSSLHEGYLGNDKQVSDETSEKDDEEQRHTTELQQYYLLDSFRLAKWFFNWFSQLGSWFWGPQVTLNDCLSIFFGTDPLEGDNEYSCEVCTKKNRGVKYLKIMESPEVLCVHFKRYESVGSAKITTHVSFPLTGLDLAPFMGENCRPQCTTYNLIACICHHGSALLTGHYTTYALNCYDDQWYEFDDQCVSSVSSYQVENSEAYILFYQKSTLDDSIDKQRVKASKLLKKSLRKENINKYFISKQWVNKFNTFVEPGPITNHDFLCKHEKISKSKYKNVGQLCHPISETVWNYLLDLHGGGPTCQELVPCGVCE